MTVRNANVKGIDLLAAPAGMNKGGVALVSFDLLATAQSGGGTDTIQLGGGGYNQEVATTQTLAQMIAARMRNGGTVTLTGALGPIEPGYQAGNPLYPQNAVVSGGNVTTIGIYTTATGSSGQSTTSSGWDAAAVIAVGFVNTVG